MSRAVVFSTEALPPEAKSLLSEYEVFESKADESVMARCEALVCWQTQLKRETLGKMKSLRMVQTLSAGVDLLDFGSLPPSVQVFSNAGAYTETVGEHAWGMLLGIAKGIHLRKQRSTPRSLRGKTLLVIGCGAIGSEVARLAKSLDMKVVGISRSFKSPEYFDERSSMADLPVHIGRVDAVVLTLPLTNKTRGVLNYDLLATAKKEMILVNVGRGELVSEEGVLRWLRERPECRFATDVYWFKDGRESFDTKAWDLTNFAGTLHVSGLPLGEDLSNAKVAAVRNVKRFFEGATPLNRVDVSEYV